MKYNTLGNSDLKVSEVSYGCMSLGEDHEKNAKLLLAAVEQGINFFDTADLYDKGNNEITVGKAFRGIRDKVIISSKVGNQWRSDGSGWDWNPRKEYILKAVEDSLKRLQTDYIDLYQLHGGTIDDPIDETIEAFELLQQQGKIRFYGISSIRPNVIREWVKRSSIVSLMMQYSLLDRRPEEECLDLAQQHGVSVLARGAYAKGLLLGKPATPYLAHTAEEVERAARKIRSLADTNRTAAQVAGRYVLHHPAVASAVLGIRIRSHLHDAIAISLANPLSAEDLEKLRNSAKPVVYEEHR
ncbi:aldo/keto reductase [Cesiribacter sp. SM1]|uniref:aldo/keto reductase n=1 Tax=Cesiribacter sp. SM1 TaxID=2861196 RepID=UPI001CD7CEF3|nr:aldo/keto reductase [Cesiribacter sp. SM1]